MFYSSSKYGLACAVRDSLKLDIHLDVFYVVTVHVILVLLDPLAALFANIRLLQWRSFEVNLNHFLSVWPLLYMEARDKQHLAFAYWHTTMPFPRQSRFLNSDLLFLYKVSLNRKELVP